MNSSRPLSRAVIALALACVLGFFGAGPAATAAENSAGLRTISVSGEGEVSAKPDQAHLSAGVVTQAPTATAALSANTAAMNRVFGALKLLGIPDERIRTSNFSVQPQYPPFRPDAAEPRTITGYQVSNQVTVIVDELSKLGAVLDALVGSGANQVGGVSFAIADPKPLAERARAAAVEAGIAKARTLATAAGVTLGPLLSIQEGGGIRPVPVFAAVRADLVAAPAPVAIGEQSVTVNVTMIYAIQ